MRRMRRPWTCRAAARGRRPRAARGLAGRRRRHRQTPGRMTGEMCARITVAELEKPLRFCNRYVSSSGGQGEDGGSTNAVLGGASNDLGGALGSIDAFTGKPPRVTAVSVLLKLHRGADQAFILDSRCRRARVAASGSGQGRPPGRPRRPASPAPTRCGFPATLRSGNQALRLVGTGRGSGRERLHDDLLGDDTQQDEGGDPSPGTLEEVAERSGRPALGRRDLRIGRIPRKAFRATTAPVGPGRHDRPRGAVRIPSRCGRSAAPRPPPSHSRHHPAPPKPPHHSHPSSTDS